MYDRFELLDRLLKAIEHCDMGAYESKQSGMNDLSDDFERALEILERAQDKF